MKSKYVFIGLGVLTLLTFLYIFDNVFSIWEQASYARFRPVTTGLPSEQIARDVLVGDVSADIYTAPQAAGDKQKRPLLIVIHGGFLQGGNKKNYAYLGGLGVRSGYAVAVLQLPSFPGIFTKIFYSAEALKSRSLPAQAKRLAGFLSELKPLGEKYGFDAERVHVLAHGSGALLLGGADVKKYRSIVLVSPIFSLVKDVAQIAPMQLRALDGYVKDADALQLSPAEWLKTTSSPVLILCTERDLPYIKDACKNLQLTRPAAKPMMRVIVPRPSHFELMFHLGSKVEEATEPFKKFLFDNNKP